MHSCLLLTYVLSLGVNAVDHTVAPIPSNDTRITLNAYVCSCSTPSFSSPANSAMPCRLSLFCLFVTFVHRTQLVEIFGKFSMLFDTVHPLTSTDKFTEIVPEEPLCLVV